MRKVSRRELARMLAALPTLGAVPLGGQVPAPSGYIGPLTGITKGLDGRRFDPVPFTRDLYAAAPRRLRFEARTRGQAEGSPWRLSTRAPAAPARHTRDPRVPRLPARENRVRQPARRQRARVPPASRKREDSCGDDDLRARPRPRRR